MLKLSPSLKAKSEALGRNPSAAGGAEIELSIPRRTGS
jgi:hypothetical protein